MHQNSFFGGRGTARPRLGFINLRRIPRHVTSLYRTHDDLRHLAEGFGELDLGGPSALDRELARNVLRLDATPEEAAAAIYHRHRAERSRFNDIEYAIEVVCEVWSGGSGDA